jgi:acetyl-CoA carboxylase biotin carboxyl carrier protein
VSEGEDKTPRPFDVQTVRYLVKLMSRHDLTEIDLREGELRIRLQRGTLKAAAPAMDSVAPAVVPTLPAQPAVAPPPIKVSDDTPAKKFIEIKSPTPGTFYAASSPDAEPFVKVGSKVQPNTVVCIIEAMKVFNEITADCSGTIVAILAENQQPIEYGQVLFKVDATG